MTISVLLTKLIGFTYPSGITTPSSSTMLLIPFWNDSIALGYIRSSAPFLTISFPVPLIYIEEQSSN